MTTTALCSETRSAFRPARALRLLVVPALGLGLVVSLAACSGASSTAGSSAPSSTTTGGTQAAALTITDAWAKAADSGMTAVFGTITNSSASDVRIVSATSPAAGMTQIHEMVADAAGQMVMKEKKDGLVVPAGGSHELSPGGDHLMLMDLTGPVRPGDDVTLTLTTDDGSTFELTAQARDFTGGNEPYGGGATPTSSADGMAGMGGTSSSPSAS